MQMAQFGLFTQQTHHFTAPANYQQLMVNEFGVSASFQSQPYAHPR